MRNIIKKNKQYIIFFIVFALILILVASIFIKINFPFFKIESNNNWLSFYGSFFGSVLAAAITALGIFLTLERDRRIRLEEQQKELEPILILRGTYKTSPKIIEFEITSVGKGIAFNTEIHFNLGEYRYIGGILPKEKFSIIVNYDDKILSNDIILHFSDSYNNYYYLRYEALYYNTPNKDNERIPFRAIGSKATILPRDPTSRASGIAIFRGFSPLSKKEITERKGLANKAFFQRRIPTKIFTIENAHEENAYEITLECIRDCYEKDISNVLDEYLSFISSDYEVVIGDIVIK